MTDNHKHWAAYGESRRLIHCWWKCRLVQPLWKTVRQFVNLLNMYLPCDPVFSLLGIYPREIKTYVHTKICSPMFIFHNISKTWRTQISVNWWMDKKMQHIKTMDYCPQKIKLLIQAITWMYLKNAILKERSHTQKTIYHVIPLKWDF